jgi:hypothetical protein
MIVKRSLEVFPPAVGINSLTVTKMRRLRGRRLKEKAGRKPVALAV